MTGVLKNGQVFAKQRRREGCSALKAKDEQTLPQTVEAVLPMVVCGADEWGCSGRGWGPRVTSASRQAAEQGQGPSEAGPETNASLHFAH